MGSSSKGRHRSGYFGQKVYRLPGTLICQGCGNRRRRFTVVTLSVPGKSWKAMICVKCALKKRI